jgi:uncharacterized protein YhaN
LEGVREELNKAEDTLREEPETALTRIEEASGRLEALEVDDGGEELRRQAKSLEKKCESLRDRAREWK